MTEQRPAVYCECMRQHVPKEDCGRCVTPEDVRTFARRKALADGEVSGDKT